ncbi:MAG: hypothetical protein ACTHMC_07795 [Pseudobacter sp.]|uniref:hypothetical protein n=1 Tax=Pseudobacter sp. TaxID=2045420 RepID=UPI003F7F1A97
MGAPFTDITLYGPTRYPREDPRHAEETALANYVSDLYVWNMNGYKPVGATRICIQPAFYGIWKGPNKLGSVVSVATEFNHDQYEAADKTGRYHYVLELIHKVMLELSDEYNWDKSVFENAYNSVIRENFRFAVNYPVKHSKDRKKKGCLRIEKTETIASLFVHIETENGNIDIKIFDKKNFHWDDATYQFAKNQKWFNNDAFGFSWSNATIVVYYSIEMGQLFFFESCQPVQTINFRRHMLL